jgi:hypothetical protein
MERPRVNPDRHPKHRQRNMLAAAALLTLAALTAPKLFNSLFEPDGNYPGSKIIQQELASGKAQDGRHITMLITITNAPIEVGIIGGGPGSLDEAGILPKDTIVDPILIFDAGNGDKTAAFSCESVRPYLYVPWKESTIKDLESAICYIDKPGSFTPADY